MSSVFTPTELIDVASTREREWAAAIGSMDWDETKIVFTKRTLLEFLQTTGLTIDMNCRTIQRLPFFAEFGKFEVLPGSESSNTSTTAPSQLSDQQKEASEVSEAEDSTASSVVPKNSQAPVSTQLTAEPDVVPSRRVRTVPGGTSSLASLWDPITTDEFKPTRRVREMPGGRDSISEML